MTPGNFNWFLHTMLFVHTIRAMKKSSKNISEDEFGDMDDEE